jgi:hypothetical protein
MMANDFVDAMANALSTWHDSPSTDPLVYDHLVWSGGMRDSNSFDPYSRNHPIDPAFDDNSSLRNKIESGIPFGVGGLVNPIGSNTCI